MRRVPGLVSRVPGLLEPCLPSLCFFLWSIRVSGLHQGSGILGLLSPIIVFFLVVYQGSGILEPCLPSLCLFCGPSGRGTSSGFRDSWTYVSHHCVSSGSGTCLPSSGTFGTLSPIIVFFLVVYQGSGIFGTLSPIIVFVLWSIRARDFIWVSISGSRGLVPGMRSEFRGCAGFRDLSPGFRDFWNLVSHHCVSFYGPSGFRGFIRVPGFLDFCLPSLCFFLWFIRAPGFLEPCLPSLCLFCGPSGRGTSSGFRDSWTFVPHHCVFSCGLSGLRDFWNLVSHHCVCSVVHQGAGLHQGFGILGLLFPIIVFLLVPGLVSRVPGLVSRVSGLLEPCLPSLCFFLWFMRAPGFLEIPNSSMLLGFNLW